MSPEATLPPLAQLLVDRPEPGHDLTTGPVSRELYSRLTEADVEAVQAVLDEGARQVWDATTGIARERLAVMLGVHHEIPGVLERTGLTNDVPPEHVHAMARGPLAAGGDLYTADVLMRALQDIGADLKEGTTFLDFGCSSGRVLRALAGYRPDLRLLGCDPNAEAVAWAHETLPIGRFFASEKDPPLALEDGEVDVAFAISIWSHFAAEPALTWLHEMSRVVHVGGLLVLTTHGWDSLAVGMRREVLSPWTVQSAAHAMTTEGFFFIDVFGDDGDWGVDKAGWGNAYLTLDWLAARLGPRWALRSFLPGGLDHYQDVVVLQRVV